MTVASDTAAPFILLGCAAGAMGGYSGNDPALDGAGLARLVRRGEARYVVLGGAYPRAAATRAHASPSLRALPAAAAGSAECAPRSLP